MFFFFTFFFVVCIDENIGNFFIYAKQIENLNKIRTSDFFLN